MSGIKYYRLKDGEDLPDEFCAVRDADGEPSEYAWYEPMNSFDRKLQAENAKLRELVRDMWFWHYEGHIDSESQERQMLHIDAVIQRMRELGVEVSEDLNGQG